MARHCGDKRGERHCSFQTHQASSSWTGRTRLSSAIQQFLLQFLYGSSCRTLGERFVAGRFWTWFEHRLLLDVRNNWLFFWLTVSCGCINVSLVVPSFFSGFAGDVPRPLLQHNKGVERLIHYSGHGVNRTIYSRAPYTC
jgi:hypothetical protein